MDIPTFDIVYSLGFIEHFLDLDETIYRHLKLLKPGGILAYGIPNFLGVNHWFLKRLAPDLLSKHSLFTMNIENWGSFEKKFNLKCLFKGYVGGFEAGVFYKCENKTIINQFLKFIAKIFYHTLRNRFKMIRKFNSKYFSGYVMGVYQKPFNP